MKRRDALASSLVGSAGALLPRMRRDFERDGELRTSTAAAMWGCYGGAALLYAAALRTGAPAGRRVTAAAGVAGACGLLMTVAGMGRFSSPSHVTGSTQEGLATGGVYRLSRNPQYVGYVIAGLAGAAARRSPLAAALTVGYAGICRWWVPVEERALQREFGAEYERFREATPRWLGMPRRP